MNRPLTGEEKDRIWALFRSLTAGERQITKRRQLGMAVIDQAAICCHLAQQEDEQRTQAARKVLRTLLGSYDQAGVKTAVDLVLSRITCNAAEIAELLGAHIEVQRAFPVLGGDDD